MKQVLKILNAVVLLFAWPDNEQILKINANTEKMQIQ